MNRRAVATALVMLALATHHGSSVDSAAVVDETADLALIKVADRSKVRPGHNVVYTITLTNHGPGAATGVVFGDFLPDELNRVSFTCRQGTPPSELDTICAVDVLQPGASATAILEATPIPRVKAGDRITNTAFIVQSSTPDPNTTNNSASATVKVVGKRNPDQ